MKNTKLSPAELLEIAQSICKELREAHPEHADALQRVRFLISHRMFRALGKAHPVKGLVKISYLVFQYPQNWGSLQDTIRHELAHIAAGPGQGHGRLWKRIAVLFGAKPASKNFDLEYIPKELDRRVPGHCEACCLRVSIGPIQAKRIRRGERYYHAQCSSGRRGGKIRLGLYRETLED